MLFDVPLVGYVATERRLLNAWHIIVLRVVDASVDKTVHYSEHACDVYADGGHFEHAVIINVHRPVILTGPQGTRPSTARSRPLLGWQGQDQGLGQSGCNINANYKDLSFCRHLLRINDFA